MIRPPRLREIEPCDRFAFSRCLALLAALHGARSGDSVRHQRRAGLLRGRHLQSQARRRTRRATPRSSAASCRAQSWRRRIRIAASSSRITANSTKRSRIRTPPSRLDPDSASAHVNRGNVYYRAKRHDEAVADYNQAITLSDGAFAPAYFNRAQVAPRARRERCGAPRISSRQPRSRRDLRRSQRALNIECLHLYGAASCARPDGQPT